MKTSVIIFCYFTYLSSVNARSIPMRVGHRFWGFSVASLLHSGQPCDGIPKSVLFAAGLSENSNRVIFDYSIGGAQCTLLSVCCVLPHTYKKISLKPKCRMIGNTLAKFEPICVKMRRAPVQTCFTLF